MTDVLPGNLHTWYYGLQYIFMRKSRHLPFFRLSTSILATLLCLTSLAQGSEDYGSGLKLNMDEDGEKYVRFILWNQIWFQYQENNPGTLVNGQPQTHTWDIGARRLRLFMYAQISPRYSIVAHIGINNQTFATGGGSGTSGTGPYGAGKKPQLFFHDAWNEFAVIPAFDLKTGEENKNTLYLGAGLHYWWGISRLTSGSTLNFLAIDAPIFNWPLIEVSDQFGRQYGVYAKGHLNRLNYTVSLNKPFATNLEPVYDGLKNQPVAIDNNGDSKPALQAYADYQFLEKESNKFPYRVGTYIGTKRVFNLGAGFLHTQDGTKSVEADGTFQKHDITLWSVDAFADLPFGDPKKNMAITAYAVYYNYDFGPNYWRTVALMNTGTSFDPALPPGERTLNGPGNGRMLLGTGDLIYTQAGWLLPRFTNSKLRLQPFGAMTWKKLDYLDSTGNYWDVGANFFIDGHHAKITTQYSTRPVYFVQDNQRVQDGVKGEFLLQVQIYL
jgi:hypothetical protein